MCGLTNPRPELEDAEVWQTDDEDEAERERREAADFDAATLNEAYDYDRAIGYLG